MKIILKLLFLVFISSCSSKSVVLSKGYGKDRNEALNNAKILAVEIAAGIWINNEQQLINDNFDQRTAQYSSGSIDGYKIVKESADFVEIEAVVVKRSDNSVVQNKYYLTEEGFERIADAKRLNESKIEAASSLDDIDKALIFEISKTTIKPEDHNYLVEICGTVKFRQKWIDDYSSFKTKDLNLFFITAKHDIIISGLDKANDEIYISPKSNHPVDLGIYDSYTKNVNYGVTEGICVSLVIADISKISHFQSSFISY